MWNEVHFAYFLVYFSPTFIDKKVGTIYRSGLILVLVGYPKEQGFGVGVGEGGGGRLLHVFEPTRSKTSLTTEPIYTTTTEGPDGGLGQLKVTIIEHRLICFVRP